MNKYKVGDRVRILKSAFISVILREKYNGKLGTIIAVDKSVVKVRMMNEVELIIGNGDVELVEKGKGD